MLYILAALLGLISGFFFKGTLGNFAKMDIRHKWAFISAFFLQFAFQVLCVKSYGKMAEYSLYIQAMVFMLLLAGFWLNRNLLGSLITGLGCALNAAAMLVNNGKMPVSPQIVNNILINNADLKKALLSDGKHVLADETTRLLPLIDNIYLPGFFGVGMRIVSIGDLIVVAGIFVLVLELTLSRKFGMHIKSENIKS